MEFDGSDVESFHSESEDETQEILAKPRRFHNNIKALNERFEDILYNGEWIERLDVVCDMKDLKMPMPENDENADMKSSGATLQSKGSIHDDFKREMNFYCQAQVATKEALQRLNSLRIPTERPEDYFAEMVKTDAHMHKIREKLATEKQIRENAEKAKKVRRLKKFGKKVQQEVLQKRQQEKKRMLQAVDRIKKGKQRLNEGGNDLFDIKTDSANNKSQKSLKRKKKDQKYGFGGKKKRAKINTASTSGDMSSFKSSIHSKAPRNKNKGKPKRLGKSRRNHQKSKKR